MNKFSNIKSLLFLLILGVNTIGAPVIAINELQKKPSNSEEHVAESQSESEEQPTSTIKEEVKKSSSADKIETVTRSKESATPLVTESLSKVTSAEKSATSESTEVVTEEIGTYGLSDMPALPADEKIKRITSVFADPVGTGSTYSEDGKILLINPSEGSKLGAIWSKNKINIKKDFRFKAYLYMANAKGESAGDGLTFTIQNDEKSVTALAAGGAGLGAYTTGRAKNVYSHNAHLN